MYLCVHSLLPTGLLDIVQRALPTNDHSIKRSLVFGFGQGRSDGGASLIICSASPGDDVTVLTFDPGPSGRGIAGTCRFAIAMQIVMYGAIQSIIIHVQS